MCLAIKKLDLRRKLNTNTPGRLKDGVNNHDVKDEGVFVVHYLKKNTLLYNPLYGVSISVILEGAKRPKNLEVGVGEQRNKSIEITKK